MEEKFLKLTNTVYKALEFFPESDPLKIRAKDKVLAIMDNLVLVNEVSGWASFQKEKVKVNLSDDIDTLLGYLWIGKAQGWMNSVNYLIIANEYEKVKREIGLAAELTQKLQPLVETYQESLSDPSTTSDRKGKIVEFISKNEKAQVMDLQTILPDITKRTIRRDLDELLESGKIVRMGDFNQVFYKIKG